jgi:LysM repeat protein
MASSDIDRLDAPACPFLGLVVDRRSRFTYPHPGHRCFATKHPATTDARRQVTSCLSLDFAACDRYPAQPTSDTGSVAAPGTTIHVLRAGGSLATIAARYGLTVEQIAVANGLDVNDAVADGTRLVIPLDTRSVSDRDPDQTKRRKSRSG